MIALMLVVGVFVVLIGSVVLLIQKIVLKHRMRRGLGRKVEDRELTSLNSWMKAASPSDDSRSQSAKRDNGLTHESVPQASKSLPADKTKIAPASLKEFAAHAAQRTGGYAYYRVGYEFAAWSVLTIYVGSSLLLIYFLVPASKILIPLGLFVTILLFKYLRGKAKRYAIDTAQAIRRDERVPILYLRSFEHDAGKASWSAVSWKPRQSFEQPYTKATELQLTSALAPIGPVVVVGEPGEELPGVGGLRLYFASDEWREKVQELMRISRFVIIHPGKTDGVAWEMTTAKQTLDPKRLVFVFASWHSLKRYGRQIEYDIFASQLRHIFDISLPEKFNGAYFLYFTSDWSPRFAFPIWYKRWLFRGRSKHALRTSLNRIVKDANNTVAASLS